MALGVSDGDPLHPEMLSLKKNFAQDPLRLANCVSLCSDPTSGSEYNGSVNSYSILQSNGPPLSSCSLASSSMSTGP